MAGESRYRKNVQVRAHRDLDPALSSARDLAFRVPRDADLFDALMQHFRGQRKTAMSLGNHGLLRGLEAMARMMPTSQLYDIADPFSNMGDIKRQELDERLGVMYGPASENLKYATHPKERALLENIIERERRAAEQAARAQRDMDSWWIAPEFRDN